MLLPVVEHGSFAYFGHSAAWNWSPPALAKSLPYAGCLLHVKSCETADYRV
jgi:hypothetical protein